MNTLSAPNPTINSMRNGPRNDLGPSDYAITLHFYATRADSRCTYRQSMTTKAGFVNTDFGGLVNIAMTEHGSNSHCVKADQDQTDHGDL